MAQARREDLWDLPWKNSASQFPMRQAQIRHFQVYNPYLYFKIPHNISPTQEE